MDDQSKKVVDAVQAFIRCVKAVASEDSPFPMAVFDRDIVLSLFPHTYIHTSRSSALPTYSIMTHTGVWRFLTVRSSQRTGQCLIMLCVSLTKGVPLDLWQQEEKKLVAYLTAPSQPILPMEMVSSEQQANGPDTKTWTGITSIFLQVRRFACRLQQIPYSLLTHLPFPSPLLVHPLIFPRSPMKV